MRRLLIAVIVITVLGGGLVVFSAVPAQADTVCGQVDPTSGKCLIWIEVPATPGNPGDDPDDGPKDTGSGKSCWWDGRPQNIHNPPPGPVPCNSEYGYWSNTWNCYIQLLHPQPPAGDPSRQGHEPGDGAVYQCYQHYPDLLIWIWSADPPPDSGNGPTPREVAQIAIEQMDLRAIDIGITPRPGDGSVGIVGMPVWMWAANPDSHTVGPITASASAGGLTITATARLHKITWDMGDGTKVICTKPGKPYKAAYGDMKSPDCGHVYTTSSSSKPDHRFAVTATSDWVIDWEGAGQTGTIRLNGLVREAQIAIGEAQVLVQ
ncbi:hypothetical protein [Nocardioides sp. GXZ039]|uniref:hypothetical protein n=1 Tax=Nocardioides sp. GXZ039 TaxID=3136018 RepID=UPI0030F42028